MCTKLNNAIKGGHFMTNGTSQGLFVVVAIIISGVFIAISYLLFRNTLKPSLSTIFTDSLEQFNCSLSGECSINISSTREDEHYLYAKIREANLERNETEIWIQAEKLENNGLRIVKSSITDSNYNSGTPDMVGSLSFPDTINGKPITHIGNKNGDYPFRLAKLDGHLKLPNKLQYIGYDSFLSCIFEGTIELPPTLTYIDNRAFRDSKFTKSIEFPTDLEYVGTDSFMYSKFSGNLIINHSLKEIGNRAFYSSEFEKVINNSKDLMIQSQSIRLEDNTYYTL